jgi:hypothetical protein
MNRLPPVFPRLSLLPALGCFILALGGCSKGAEVKGRVLNARTKQPLPGASVTITFTRIDANMNWLDAGTASVTSDEKGEFEAHNDDMRARFMVLVRKDGFYPNYESLPMRTTERHSLGFTHNAVVILFPIESPQNLPQGKEGVVRYYPPGRRMGWSLAAGRMVDEAAADFVGEPDEAGKSIVRLIARGNGGLARAGGLTGQWVLYNLVEAPEEGYQKEIDLREFGQGQVPACFVRTADGRHYGKIVVTGNIRSREYAGLGFEWVFQPDGSRRLEIPLPK